MGLFGRFIKKEKEATPVMEQIPVVRSEAGNHNMSLNKYEVKAVYVPTNRIRKLTLFGKDEADVRIQLTEYKEPESIQLVSYDPPTEAQISFARKLKIRIPKKCCKEDMSGLIDEALRKEECELEGKKWKHISPGKGLVVFADSRHIPYSYYSEEFRVIRDIWWELRGAEEIAFMIACMHKHVKGKWDFGKWNQWVTDGEVIAQDKSFQRSLQNSDGLEDGFYGFDWKGISERSKAYQMLKEKI